MENSQAASGSLIIASANRPEVLGRCLRRVRALLPRDWEIIVVDDGSNPPFDADQFATTKLLRNPTSMGRGAARNRGASEAAGVLVAFMDDDVFPLPSTFERLLRSVGSFGVWVAPVEQTTHEPVDPDDLSGSDPPDVGPVEVHMAPSGLLVTQKKTFDAIGGFSTEITRLLDYDLSLRGRVAGHRMLQDRGAHFIHEDIHHSFRDLCLREHDSVSFLPTVWGMNLPEPPSPDEWGYTWFWENLRTRWLPIRWLGHLLQPEWSWRLFLRFVPVNRPRPDSLARLIFRIATVRGARLGLRRADPSFRKKMLMGRGAT